MNIDTPTFNTNVIKPVDCLKAGWQLIKDDYWLYLGITVVGMLIAGLAPMGILAGPAMCGIYICLLRRVDGKQVNFVMLFDGFNYFVQSLIATLFLIVPTLAIVVFTYIIALVVALLFAVAGQQDVQASPVAVVITFIVIAVVLLLILALVLILGILFSFTYPLIVDRQMKGLDAIKLSFRAVRANFKSLVVLHLLNMLLGFAGSLLCCIGAYFIMPVTLAAGAIAYRQIFPASLDRNFQDVP